MGLVFDLSALKGVRLRQPSGGADRLGETASTWSESWTGPVQSIVITIKWGLPRLQFQAVLAHELFHMWMRLARPAAPVMLDAEEGLAELTRYKFLEAHRQDPYSRLHRHEIEHNADPIYGDGFRTARRLEAKHGWTALVDHVAQVGRFPA